MATILNQITQLSFDLPSNSVKGITRIHFKPQDQQKISLHCKQIVIQKVQSQTSQIQFTYPPPSHQVQYFSYALNNTLETNDLMDMTWQMWDYECQQGFLSFNLPRGPDPVVQIEYTLQSPLAGLRFFSYNSEKLVVTESYHESKRFWMPCLDTLHCKYPVKIEFQVPESHYVISSGELSGYLKQKNFNVFQYSIETYISTIGFCILPFPEIFNSPSDRLTTHFSLNRKKDLQFTIDNVKYGKTYSRFSYEKMMENLASRFGKPFPFTSQKVVFLPYLGESLRFAGLSLFDESLLLNEKVYEGFNKTIRELVAAAAYNWLECFHRMANWEDYWLVLGLEEYLARDYIGEVIDANELKFVVNKEVKLYCGYVEKGLELRPLCSLFYTSPHELQNDPVFKLKSGLIFHMIEVKVGKINLIKVLHEFLSPMSSTSEFIKLFKKLYRKSLKEFAKSWIYGTGAPLLKCEFSYNKKDNALDFKLEQCPIFQNYLDSSANKQFNSLGNTNYSIPMRINMMRFYTGPLNLMIYETDGTDTEIDIKSIEVDKEIFKTQIPCKKRLKKPSNPKRREENEEEKTNREKECPVLWVRVDPDCEMLRKVEVSYKDLLWMDMLKKEKEDVIAQYEAIVAARANTDLGTEQIGVDYTKILNLLYEKLEDKKCFYSVRMKAAKSLSAISYAINAYKGLNYLIYYFKTRHFDKKYLKPNDFSSRDEYFVDKTVLRSIVKVSDMSLTHNFSRIRVNSGFVVEFLAEVLRNNDNSTNFFDDSYWRANLFEVLGRVTNPVYIDQIYSEMIRMLKVDLAIPSYNYSITKYCLRGLLHLSQHHKMLLTSTFTYLSSIIPYYPPKIQGKILWFMVKYQFIQHSSPLTLLKTPLSLIHSYPHNSQIYIKVLQKILLKLSSIDWVLHEARSSETFKSELWSIATSSFSQYNSYFSSTLLSFVKYFFPRTWSSDELDPAWEEKPDADPSQHRFEAIDLSKGSWEDWAQEVVSRMMKHEYSEPFLRPVDYEELELYDYPEVITHPMDFSTVQHKLKEKDYKNFHDFVADVRLIFDNCRLYNAEGCMLYKHAEVLDSLCRDLVAPIEEFLGISQPKVNLKFRMFAGDIQLAS